MDWKGLPITPQGPPATPEEKSILERIELRIATSKKLLRENRMTQGNLNFLIGFIRTQMTKLYGKDSETTKCFSPIRVKLDLVSITKKYSILILDIQCRKKKIKKNSCRILNHKKKPSVRNAT